LRGEFTLSRKIKSERIPHGIFSKIAKEEDILFNNSHQKGVLGDLQEADRKGVNYDLQKYKSMCKEIELLEQDPDIKDNKDKFEYYYHEANTENEIKIYNRLLYYRNLVNAKNKLKDILGI
jgi:hypothetical protein